MNFSVARVFLGIILALGAACSSTTPQDKPRLTSEDNDSQAIEAEREANYQIAETFRVVCQQHAATEDVGALMRAEKEALAMACELDLGIMEIYSSAWRRAIDMGINFSVYISLLATENELRGRLAPSKAADECVRPLMAHIREVGGIDQPAFSDLLDYYSLYTQIYDLALQPQGSLMSYNQQMSTFKSENVRMKSRLAVLLP